MRSEEFLSYLERAASSLRHSGQVTPASSRGEREPESRDHVDSCHSGSFSSWIPDRCSAPSGMTKRKGSGSCCALSGMTGVGCAGFRDDPTFVIPGERAERARPGIQIARRSVMRGPMVFLDPG